MKLLLNTVTKLFVGSAVLSLTVIQPLSAQPLPAQSVVIAQSNSPFYTEPQSLTPEQINIQNYKMQRLRIQTVQQDWYITRGVNQRISEETLLKMTGNTERLKTRAANQNFGNTITIGGLGLMALGALFLSNLIAFDNSFWYGLGAFLTGGAVALVGESWAGNLQELDGHMIERFEAETLIKEYNAQLKKEMGLENVPNL